MKTLKFRPVLIPDILNGKKTSTWRIFDDKDLQIGDQLELVNWETKEKFADAEIVDMREKQLGEMKEADFDGHATYENQEQMLADFRKYYADGVTLETPVKIIHFRLLYGAKQ